MPFWHLLVLLLMPAEGVLFAYPHKAAKSLVLQPNFKVAAAIEAGIAVPQLLLMGFAASVLGCSQEGRNAP